MDYETVDGDTFGRSLRGIGLNILVRSVPEQVAFLTDVFGMTAHQPTTDFAIMVYGDQVFQIHADGTYSANPLLSLVPENPPRGAGIEIRLYETDPDAAAAIAEAMGATILQPPTDKPHGLREAYILCANGYAWVPSRAKD
jgi:catechol 2,3-dioxygenase-like lactoylglutathione lyase family enzyme